MSALAGWDKTVAGRPDVCARKWELSVQKRGGGVTKATALTLHKGEQDVSVQWKKPLVNVLRDANKSSQPSDQAAFPQGSGAADAWLAMMRPRLVRLARQFLANAEDAEEIAQEALALAWRRWAEVKDAGKRNAWVYRTTINLCLNLRRKRRPSETLVEVAAREETGRAVECGELAERLRIVIADLPENQQAALALREVEGLGYDAIAAILEVKASAARVMVHRAREGVRQMLLRRWPETFG